MATVWKKVIFYPFFSVFNFLKIVKKQNFEMNLLGAIEGYIKKVHAKFQVNRFIRTWDIMSKVSTDNDWDRWTERIKKTFFLTIGRHNSWIFFENEIFKFFTNTTPFRMMRIKITTIDDPFQLSQVSFEDRDWFTFMRENDVR